MDDPQEEVKQVVVVNQALKLPKGKLAAQVAHASVGAFLEAEEADQEAWLFDGMPKVILACPDANALLRLRDLAKEKGIVAFLVADAGRTVLPEGTLTCLGIGPARAGAIDALTGELKLL